MMSWIRGRIRRTLPAKPQAWGLVALLAGLLAVGGCGNPDSTGSGEESPEQRLRALRSAYDDDPENIRTLVRLSAALVEAGQLREAAARLEDVVRLDPDDPQAHRELGTLYAELEERQQAIEHYRKSLEVMASPDVHVLLGIQLGRSGNGEEAISHYEQALVLKPEYADAHYNLGVELGRAGRTDEAKSHYREVLRIDDRYVEAANNLGVELFAEGEYAEAAELFEKAVEANLADVDAGRNWAMALQALGRTGDAVRVLEEGLARDPDSAPMANQLAWIRAASPEAEWRDGEKAVRLAERACELTRHANANYLDTLAAAYAEAGQWPEAIRTSKRALKVAGDESDLAAGFRERLALFERKKPYRDP